VVGDPPRGTPSKQGVQVFFIQQVPGGIDGGAPVPMQVALQRGGQQRRAAEGGEAGRAGVGSWWTRGHHLASVLVCALFLPGITVADQRHSPHLTPSVWPREGRDASVHALAMSSGGISHFIRPLVMPPSTTAAGSPGR
jgi:hypothetical protein